MVWDSTKSMLTLALAVAVILLVKEKPWSLANRVPQQAAIDRVKSVGIAVAFMCLGLWLFLPSALNLDDFVGGNAATSPVLQERMIQELRKTNDLIGDVLLALRWALFGVGLWISWIVWLLTRYKLGDSHRMMGKGVPEAAA
jgi:hypothetical protein